MMGKLRFLASKVGWEFHGSTSRSTAGCESALLGRGAKMVWLTVGTLQGKRVAMVSTHLPKDGEFGTGTGCEIVVLNKHEEPNLETFWLQLERCAYEIPHLVQRSRRSAESGGGC